MSSPTTAPQPPTWALATAFAVIYTAWGTTYLAIQEGVRTLPPCLFGGVRVALAGLLLLVYLRLRGHSIRLTGRELAWAVLLGVMFFVGGNGLLTAAEKTVASSAAAVLVTTTPLWVALLENIWPSGERLNWRGWLGLGIGGSGVLWLLGPKLEDPQSLLTDFGPLLVLGSSLSWAIGSFALRYSRPRGAHLTTAAYHMLLGGGIMTVVGLMLGEASELTPEVFTHGAVISFFYLLIVGSLIGFLVYTWLLRHVSATLVGTHAYVNPLVALLVGALLAGEAITPPIVGGMVVILTGVTLVRFGGKRRTEEVTPEAEPFRSVEPLPTPAPRQAVV